MRAPRYDLFVIFVLYIMGWALSLGAVYMFCELLHIGFYVWLDSLIYIGSCIGVNVYFNKKKDKEGDDKF